MASFYYYDQNPFPFRLIWYSRGGLIIKSPNLPKKKKTLKDSGRSSKMPPSCKWPKRYLKLRIFSNNYWMRLSMV